MYRTSGSNASKQNYDGESIYSTVTKRKEENTRGGDKKRNGFNPCNRTDKNSIHSAGNYKSTYIAGLYKSRKYGPWHRSDPPLSFLVRCTILSIQLMLEAKWKLSTVLKILKQDTSCY